MIEQQLQTSAGRYELYRNTQQMLEEWKAICTRNSICCETCPCRYFCADMTDLPCECNTQRTALRFVRDLMGQA